MRLLLLCNTSALMQFAKFLPSSCGSLLRLTGACIFCLTVLGVGLETCSIVNASEPIRLTLDGELVVEQITLPPAPPLDEVLGLESGDPVSLIFDFDSSILVAPGLPGQPQFGILELDRFEVQIGSLNFQADTPVNFDVDASVSEIGNSGINFTANLFGALTETNQSDLTLGVITALPTVISFQTSDIGVNGLSRFPTGLSGADVISDFSGSLSLFQPGTGGSNLLRIDLTDVTVTTIPEPSSAALMFVSLMAVATGRRRRANR